MEVDPSCHAEQSFVVQSSGESDSESAVHCEDVNSLYDVPTAVPDWCRSPKYNRYWRHRMNVEQWFTRHAQTVSSTNLTHNQSQYYNHSMHHSQSNSALAQCYYDSMRYWQQRYYSLLSQSQSGMGRGRIGYLRDNASFQSQNRTESRTHYTTSSKTPSTCSSTEPKLHTRKRTRGKPKHLSAKKHTTTQSYMGDIIFDVDSKLLQGSQDEEVVECHMQITDEMLEFFAQSAKHRQQRDEQKKLEEDTHNKAENTFVDIAKAGKGSTNATSAAPTVRPGQKRTAEMKLLYGKGAAMIHGMETAMQLNYDRNLDLKQPKPWPHLPLNILFK